ncbi:putative late blight resistance protein homolog R1B-16 [Salvia miltiorrhiza]|uniref:putative late blight resistance protein homolog R1B-16 n=1 Tax=Salvia miltiorrhiza TaxID=226208 RepID=UPI0025ACDE6F|nr:putative late blight resistance protein homolog R1B-16 [Salvia miltiorrhiza]
MPYHLRACFLYLGIFPRKSKFSVSKLAHMWIAEGFIPRKDGVTLEETAEEYLKELNPHADGENFLQEFRNSGPEGFYPPIDEVKKNRRVCIHAHISKFIETLISSRHQTLKIGLRSFVSHSDTEVTLHGKNISIIRAAFKLLRVLDAKPIKVNKIHSDLCLLVHLRYVTLSLNGDVLPEAISKLRNMQTLTVHTTSCTLKIEADILKMVELRHFQTNASATLPKKSKASEEDERLQTLCGISPKSCTQEFFSKLPNLKKLGICGQLGLLLLDGKNELLSKLVKVEKLKLLNQVTSPKDEDDLSKLFDQPPRFPPNLRSLTLSATSLDWKHISILGSLQELEELKLKNDAFVGDKWEVHDEGFPNLKTLKIESLHLIHWKSTSAHFPKLKRLMLSKCEKLREIPVELADISTFQELHLRNANQSAIECANDILADKLHMKQNDNNIMFELLFDD